MCLIEILPSSLHEWTWYACNAFYCFFHTYYHLIFFNQELFKRLIPHQCLGATWGQRNEAETVKATILQFNNVILRVISSILIEIEPAERAKNICAWIDIAQELRMLKNFSSLKAIVCGLQSNSVYRLSKTWALVTKSKVHTYLVCLLLK